jgi:hypothetical protein
MLPQPDAVRRAITGVSTGEWDVAISAWHELAGAYPTLASTMIWDAARHCGRLEVIRTCAPMAGEIFRHSAFQAVLPRLGQDGHLHARRQDPFAHHVQRFVDNDVIAAVRDNLADLLGRNIELCLTIADELRALSQDIGVDLLALPGAYAPSSTPATAHDAS